jgi:hypothetical protein
MTQPDDKRASEDATSGRWRRSRAFQSLEALQQEAELAACEWHRSSQANSEAKLEAARAAYRALWEGERALISIATGVRTGGRAGGKARAASHHRAHSEWQKAAEAIWAQRPRLTRRDVARIIKAHLRLGHSAKHIARYIHKP